MRLRTVAGACVALLAPFVTLAAPAAPAQAAVSNTVIFQENTDGHDCYRIPSIVKAKNGDLLAFAEARNGGASFCNDLGEIDLVMKRSTDGGKTWGAQQTVIKANGDTKGNPAPIVIPSTGRIVLLSTMQCYTNPSCGRIPRVQWSDDNGATWNAPKVLTTELGFASAPGWLATGPAHGLVLTRGEHAGRLVAGMSYKIGSQNSGSIIYSDDQGVTWHRGATDSPATTALNPQEISLVELADGRIYAAARNDANDDNKCLDDGTKNRAYAISSDGGATFSQKFTYEPDLITPVVQSSVVRMSATDQGGAYDRILFAGPSTCDRRKELVVHSSFDEGGNWTSKGSSVLVWDQDAAYSDMVQLSQSSVGVMYEAGPEYNASASIRYSVVTEAMLGAPACGAGYSVIDQQALGTAGTVYLSYNASTGKNCVSTMKKTSVGTPSATSAFLQVEDGTRVTDSGNFSYYAGPVTAGAAGKCVQWGGSAGTNSYTSPMEHCG
ncbi:sialidase-1 [Amycolatopsis bartoniae]|uniref:exo-alpha-sialidase n=1 Tax=Amycolatopsis bartoniae TaxID=941986 RepID=A0A8H9MBY6_9PSEU|nr:sialidase family protein [Amycolatopsis bartoniae]MBB2939542.1 sialidase-1 [Amycolatopsis bartoniae]TVT00034.1 exo-alpha-sialidase [Amycolatopsis bartoniae]GHF39054.1 neuraminidase [Amycolatopsis bartoniae]